MLERNCLKGKNYSSIILYQQMENKNYKTEIKELLDNHYKCIIKNAFESLEYFIIQTVTKYDDIQMRAIDSRLNKFMKEPRNAEYVPEIKRLLYHYQVDKYRKALIPIQYTLSIYGYIVPKMDELKIACHQISTSYPEYENIMYLYQNYQEIYDYFHQETEYDF